jgi:hypothetical protein
MSGEFTNGSKVLLGKNKRLQLAASEDRGIYKRFDSDPEEKQKAKICCQ